MPAGSSASSPNTRSSLSSPGYGAHEIEPRISSYANTIKAQFDNAQRVAVGVPSGVVDRNQVAGVFLAAQRLKLPHGDRRRQFRLLGRTGMRDDAAARPALSKDRRACSSCRCEIEIIFMLLHTQKSPAPFGQVDDAHPVAAGVGNVHAPLCVYRHAGGTEQLSCDGRARRRCRRPLPPLPANVSMVPSGAMRRIR